MSLTEQVFSSMSDWLKMIAKFVETARYGDAGWKTIKLLEPYMIDNNNFVSWLNMIEYAKYWKILQYLVGFHGFDNQKLIHISINIVE